MDHCPILPPSHSHVVLLSHPSPIHPFFYRHPILASSRSRIPHPIYAPILLTSNSKPSLTMPFIFPSSSHLFSQSPILNTLILLFSTLRFLVIPIPMFLSFCRHHLYPTTFCDLSCRSSYQITFFMESVKKIPGLVSCIGKELSLAGCGSTKKGENAFNIDSQAQIEPISFFFM